MSWLDELVRRSRAESWRVNTDHPSETSLDDAKFDLYFFTEKQTTQEIVDQIMRVL